MKKLTSMLVLGATALSFGQNARLDAMAGVATQGDISDVIHKAVEVVNYKDKAHMTAGRNLDGSQVGEFNFIASKSFGDMFVLGATVDTDEYIGSDFFTRARTANAAVPGGSNLVDNSGNPQTTFHPIPNLILGFDISDALAIGAEIFYDANTYFGIQERKPADPTTDWSKIDTREYITNKGFLVTANIGEDFAIAPHFGLALPKTLHKQVTTTDGTNVENSVMSESGVALFAGADLIWPVGDVDMEVDVHWAMEKYQFKSKAADVTTTAPDTYVDNSAHLLYGVTGTLNDKLLWVLEYRGFYDISRIKNEDETTDPNTKSNTDEISVTNEFALAFERPVNGFWIFDGLTPRAGFLYVAGDEKDKTVITSGDKDDSKSSRNYSEGMNLTTGFGLTKGRATIDLAANFGDWNGAISGPTAASATLTVDFGKDFKHAEKEEKTETKEEPKGFYVD